MFIVYQKKKIKSLLNYYKKDLIKQRKKVKFKHHQLIIKHMILIMKLFNQPINHSRFLSNFLIIYLQFHIRFIKKKKDFSNKRKKSKKISFLLAQVLNVSFIYFLNNK